MILFVKKLKYIVVSSQINWHNDQMNPDTPEQLDNRIGIDPEIIQIET